MNTWGSTGGGAQAGFDAVTHREAQHAGEQDREDRSERGDHRVWFLSRHRSTDYSLARVRLDVGREPSFSFIHLGVFALTTADARPFARSKFHIFSK